MQRSESVAHDLFRRRVVQTAWMALSKASHTSLSRGFQRTFNHIAPEVLNPLPAEQQSVDQIKTEMELTVLL